MTIKELKKKLAAIPDSFDDYNIFIEQYNSEFDTSMVETAEMKRVKFKDGNLYALDYALVLSDQ